MRNALLSLLLTTGLLLPLAAQITITNAVFPVVGDTLRFAVDNQPQGIVMTPPGGAQQWDFSNLQPSFTWDQLFLDPQTGIGQASFPGANLRSHTLTPNVETYLNASNQHVSLLGHSGPDPAILGLDLVAIYNPPIVQSRAPVNFFDINQTSSGLLLGFLPGLLPGVNQLPFTADSLRIRLAINRLDAVDGWGTLSIPGGTYDVLREKRVEYRETRLDAKIPPLGWLDVTDVAIQYLQLDLGVDTTVAFHFLNDQSKEPIAVCTTDNSQLLVASVQYKNTDIPSGTKTPALAITSLRVFPNPAEDVLQIQASSLAGGDYTIQIFSLPGQEAYRKTFSVTSGLLNEHLDIAGLEKGLYLCRLSNDGGQKGQAVFVKI
jgi:hypothetical protein